MSGPGSVPSHCSNNGKAVQLGKGCCTSQGNLRVYNENCSSASGLPGNLYFQVSEKETSQRKHAKLPDNGQGEREIESE